jgi:cysteinyl-tRNA synthetase
LKIANLVNKLSSLDTLTNHASMIILPILKTMLDILGLKVLEVSKNEKLQIEKLIEERNALRRAGLYLDSDAIRKKLYHSYNVELTDHKDYTSWKKVESPLHSYENRMSDNNMI